MDHYKVLGLRRQATASAIKLAYRQLARQVYKSLLISLKHINSDSSQNFLYIGTTIASASPLCISQ